ncbi:hypothetical protein KKH42_00075, partial [bacterium]|nr:hypothetical protein [bacterium]
IAGEESITVDLFDGYAFNPAGRTEDLTVTLEGPNASAAEVLDGLSDTFRRYLEKKHDFPAIFLDTREIEKEMKKRVFTTEERIKSVSFLRSCDLAKFAKKQFMPAEIEKLFKDAYAFTEIGGERK